MLQWPSTRKGNVVSGEVADDGADRAGQLPSSLSSPSSPGHGKRLEPGRWVRAVAWKYSQRRSADSY